MQVNELKLLNREKVITAVAASIASGCVACLKYHKTKAKSIGFSDNEIMEIANIALKIRKNADKFNRIDLDFVLENEQESADIDCSDDCSCHEENEEKFDDKILDTNSDDCGCD